LARIAKMREWAQYGCGLVNGKKPRNRESVMPD
jgi:hypothetical protein